jgi:hypothetical protein
MLVVDFVADSEIEEEVAAEVEAVDEAEVVDAEEKMKKSLGLQ